MAQLSRGFWPHPFVFRTTAKTQPASRARAEIIAQADFHRSSACILPHRRPRFQLRQYNGLNNESAPLPFRDIITSSLICQRTLRLISIRTRFRPVPPFLPPPSVLQRNRMPGNIPRVNRSLLLLLLLLLACFSSSSDLAGATAQPNVLLICVDDLKPLLG